MNTNYKHATFAGEEVSDEELNDVNWSESSSEDSDDSEEESVFEVMILGEQVEVDNNAVNT